MSDAPDFVGFSDESRHNTGRFRGIAVVTLPFGDLDETTAEIEGLLLGSEVREFKWAKLSSAREREAALKLVELAVRRAAAGRLRVDVLSWDTQDRRHAVRGRDDTANFGRMYFHLLTSALRRWPAGRWVVYPDEQSAMDWGVLREFVDARGTVRVARDSLFDPEPVLELMTRYGLQALEERCSAATPLVQVADLFAGMGVYSREQHADFKLWRRHHGRSGVLFEEIAAPALSRSAKERFVVIDRLADLCQAHRLGVSLRTHDALKTHDPKRPINFWWYEPQHELDRAPVKSRGR